MQAALKTDLANLIKEMSGPPELKDDSDIVALSGNELADVLLKVSRELRKEIPIDGLFQNTVSLLGESGLAERVFLFQLNKEKAILTHFWSSPYIEKFDPLGLELNTDDLSLFKLFNPGANKTVQIQDFSKYLSLPHYLFKNKIKAFFIKLKTKSQLVAIGTSEVVKIVLNLQFTTRDVIWSNEVEKALQSIVDQLASALESFAEKKKRESLQQNIIELQNNSIKEQEDLFRRFASDVHDLPCSIIPGLRQAIKNKDFDECEKLVDELHNNLRTLINEYVVPDVNLLGFTGTIFQFLNSFKKSFNGKVCIELPEDEIDIQNKTALELFKVIKEWF